MGYCVRCGEISLANQCRKCRGRSVASIATALDTIGRNEDYARLASNEKSDKHQSNAMNKAPCPKVSCSTPVGAKKGPGTKFPLIANRRPLPSWAKPTTICQGVTRSPRDCWTDNECFQPTRSGSSSGTNNESITTSPTSPTSPASPIPTALVENTSSIRTARSGLLKSSTRNSSFFLNDTRAENATTSEESEAGNVSTTRARPRLHTKLFHHDTSLSSNMNSPITPTSPQGGVNASPKTKQSTGSSHLPDVSQKKQEQEHVQAATADNSKPCKEQQASHQSKKKRICCKCNQPLRRSGNTKKGESSSRIGVPSATGNREDYAWYHYECLRCPVCDEHFTEKDYFVRHGQEVYHPKCRKAALNSSSGNSGIGKSQRQSNCTVCSKKIKTGSGGDGFDFDKGKYHFECAFVCFNCQKLIEGPNEPRKQVGGKVYCSNCPTISTRSPPVPAPRRRRCVSSGAIALASGTDLADTSPSELFRNRTRALPQLGGPSICPRCKQSISIVDLTRGPRAREWHIKCLACVTCNKRMDSDAKVHVNEQGEWLVYCRNCTDMRRRSSYMLQ